MNILITGSNGFIAKELIDFFNKDSEHNLITRNRQELDLLDKREVDTFFCWNKDKIDIVIHTATKGGSRLKADDIDVFFDNITMFKNVFDNTQKYNLLLFNFTSGAEDSVNFNMDNPYGVSKAIITSIIDKIEENIINLKIYNCFGKYELETRFIKNNIINHKIGNDIIIHKNRLFDFFYSEDLYKIICYYINKYKDGNIKTQKIDCVYKNKVTLYEVAELINNIENRESNIKIINKGLDNSYVSYNIWNDLNKIDLIGLKEGIRRVYGKT